MALNIVSAEISYFLAEISYFLAEFQTIFECYKKLNKTIQALSWNGNGKGS